VNDKEVDLTLTSTEIKILHLFGKRLDQVFSRDQILSEVWGNANVSDRTVDSHVAHLRSKIKDTDVEIQTMKNLGYYLKKKSAISSP
jgi:two-component system alkaline phosphatase synthesis response regulator PhoP